ncbi:MAG: hypothetical protein U0835_05225 [Isosphaeraceae bacterium]
MTLDDEVITIETLAAQPVALSKPGEHNLVVTRDNVETRRTLKVYEGARRPASAWSRREEPRASR